MVWHTGVGGATHSGFGGAGNERSGFYVATWQRRWLCWRSLSPTELKFNAAKTLTPRHESAWTVFVAQMAWLVALNHKTFELPFTMVSQTSHANKRTLLCDKSVSITNCFKFFGQAIWPFPLFGAACHVHTWMPTGAIWCFMPSNTVFGVKFWGLLGIFIPQFDGLTKRICFFFHGVYGHSQHDSMTWKLPAIESFHGMWRLGPLLAGKTPAKNNICRDTSIFPGMRTWLDGVAVTWSFTVSCFRFAVSLSFTPLSLRNVQPAYAFAPWFNGKMSFDRPTMETQKDRCMWKPWGACCCHPSLLPVLFWSLQLVKSTSQIRIFPRSTCVVQLHSLFHWRVRWSLMQLPIIRVSRLQN